MKPIKAITKEKIILTGYLFEANTKKCVIFIPGMASNIVEDQFIYKLGKHFAENNINFICGHTQGSFQLQQVEKTDGNFVTIGACYETFSQGKIDIKAWVDTAEKLGFKDIILMGHSYGTCKIIDYLASSQDKRVIAYNLLAPLDVGELCKSIGPEVFKKAMEYIKNNTPDKLVQYEDYLPLSAKTYFGLLTDKTAKNIPAISHDGSFESLRKINKPFGLIIGSEDPICESKEEYFTTIKQNSKFKGTIQTKIIQNSNHMFKDKEQELCQVALKITTNQIQQHKNLYEK